MNPKDLVFQSAPNRGGALVFGELEVMFAPRTASIAVGFAPLKASVSCQVPRQVLISAKFAPLAAHITALRDVRVSMAAQYPALTAHVVALSEVRATIAASMPALNARISLIPQSDVSITARLEPIAVVAMHAAYDNRCPRYLHGASASAFLVASPRLPNTPSEWQTGAPQRGGVKQEWQQASRAGGTRDSGLGISIHRKPEAVTLWATALRSGALESVFFQSALPHLQDRLQEARIEIQTASILRNTASVSHYQSGIYRWHVLSGLWQPGRRKDRTSLYRQAASTHRRGRQFGLLRWQHAWWPRTGREKVAPVVPPTPVSLNSANLLFSWPWTGSSILIFQRGYYEIARQTVVVPIRRVYMVINDVNLKRVDGNIELPTLSMTLSLDVDSWTWSFDAEMAPSALKDLEPGLSGDPVELEASINGQKFRALLESIARSREFGSSNLRISGRGRTALLDSPYAPTLSFMNPESRTAQQLVNDVLSVNGVPLGWDVQWGLTDWLVPAGVFGHQGSYISALNRVANAAGGYIQPHGTDQTIRVLPRYPLPPWQWNTVTPDFELPVDATSRESLRWLQRPDYNRVFVSGENQGVIGQVTRAGTAGDVLAPMVVDSLITEVAAARQRGLAVLSDTGRQIEVGLKLPVLAETGIIEPGAFVRYREGGIGRLGLVRSVSVQAAMVEVWQTLGVQTYA